MAEKKFGLERDFGTDNRAQTMSGSYPSSKSLRLPKTGPTHTSRNDQGIEKSFNSERDAINSVYGTKGTVSDLNGKITFRGPHNEPTQRWKNETKNTVQVGTGGADTEIDKETEKPSNSEWARATAAELKEAWWLETRADHPVKNPIVRKDMAQKLRADRSPHSDDKTFRNKNKSFYEFMEDRIILQPHSQPGIAKGPGKQYNNVFNALANKAAGRQDADKTGAGIGAKLDDISKENADYVIGAAKAKKSGDMGWNTGRSPSDMEKGPDGKLHFSKGESIDEVSKPASKPLPKAKPASSKPKSSPSSKPAEKTGDETHKALLMKMSKAVTNSTAKGISAKHILAAGYAAHMFDDETLATPRPKKAKKESIEQIVDNFIEDTTTGSVGSIALGFAPVGQLDPRKRKRVNQYRKLAQIVSGNMSGV